MKLTRMGVRLPLSRILKRPYSCNFKITERCNLRCPMCNIWKIANKSKELSFDQMWTVRDRITNLGVARVVITGGEPFLRSDLENITALFTGGGFSTTLLTNGLAASPERLEKMVQVGLDDIGISIDSLDAGTQDEMTGGKNVLGKILETLKTAVRLLPDGIVQVMTTVTPKNIKEVPGIVEFVADAGALSVINPVNLPAEKDENRLLSRDSEYFQSTKFDPAEVDNIYDRIEDMKEKGYPIIVSDRFLRESRRYLKTGYFNWKCHAGIHYFTIFSDGSLAACSDLEPKINILDPDFKRKFHSAEMKNAFAQQRAACSGCIYSCWREISYLLYDPSVVYERLKLGVSLLKKKKKRKPGKTS